MRASPVRLSWLPAVNRYAMTSSGPVGAAPGAPLSRSRNRAGEEGTGTSVTAGPCSAGRPGRRATRSGTEGLNTPIARCCSRMVTPVPRLVRHRAGKREQARFMHSIVVTMSQY